MTDIDARDIALEQKESIKLMRMSKGYQWEIKVFLKDDEATHKRLAEIDGRLRNTYGGLE